MSDHEETEDPDLEFYCPICGNEWASCSCTGGDFLEEWPIPITDPETEQ